MNLTLFVLVGGDDQRVLLWNISETLIDRNEPSPVAMKAKHNSNVFCLSFSHDKSKIFSGGNDDQVIVHNTHS